MSRLHKLSALGETDSDALVETLRWRTESAAWTSAAPTEIPLQEVRRWDTARSSPFFRHDSGRFFSVIGVSYSNEDQRDWTSTAMIDQPEVGLLGLAVASSSRGLAALIQAKAEPGTIGGTQLSPTVQATRSNQLQAHGGKPVPLLELFRSPRRVILDTVQSEHGGVFWQKRNRSMIIEVPPFEPPPGFRWVGLVDLVALLSVDNLVHADLRTVLSLGPLWQSTVMSGLSNALEQIQRWLADPRSRNVLAIRRVPLHELAGWHRRHETLCRMDGAGHEIVGVRVSACGREVDDWDQPMVKPRATGLVGLAVRERRGRLQALVRTCIEPGVLQFVEIGPTVQVAGGSQPSDATQAELARLLTPEVGGMAQRQVYFDGMQTDEGGRFFRSEVRHLIAECDIEPPSDRYRWCDLDALVSIARYGNQLNMQARDALACLLSALAWGQDLSAAEHVKGRHLELIQSTSSLRRSWQSELVRLDDRRIITD
ncbi:MAG: NDP-hexose 2,3-dehydratase family protein [Myxococcota bacterium]